MPTLQSLSHAPAPVLRHSQPAKSLQGFVQPSTRHRHPSDTVAGLKGASSQKKLMRDRLRMQGILDSYRQQKTPDQEEPAAGPAEEEGTCQAECVQEIHSAQQFEEVLHSTNSNTLIVLDIFKTSCGACKYLERGFLKMCKKGEEEHAPVVFLKHNIMNEFEEPTDLSEQLRIRAVPMFYFFKGGKEIDHFATREKGKIIDAIEKYVPGVDMHL